MPPRPFILMTNAALQEKEKEIVLRGAIDPLSLVNLKTDEYQREVLPSTKLNTIIEGFRSGSVPDIVLGMRGGDYSDEKGTYRLFSDVYIIDGLQRRTAALEIMKTGIIPSLGAVVHFNTTPEWERSQFRILNLLRNKLSPNVLLHNLHLDNSFVEMLLKLCKDPGFVLANKVSWGQMMKRSDLITALSLLKVTAQLHETFAPGMRNNHHEALAMAGQRLMEKMGRNLMRDNIKDFWAVVDECWGVRGIHFRENATALRTNFLLPLAQLFADHQSFWDDHKLAVERDLRKKLHSFPITDPNVKALAGGGSTSRQMMYDMLYRHINSGKRTKKLVPFKKYQREVEVAEELVLDLNKPEGPGVTA